MNKQQVPRVTVILLTYNRAAYLKQAINGILAQTLKDFWLIIIDNASSDNTSEVVSTFDDPRIEYIRCSKNNGSIENSNFALSSTTTPYLIITHDDDEMLPELLSRQVSIFESDMLVNLVSTNMVAMDASGSLSTAPFYPLTKDVHYSQYEFIHDYCSGKNIIGCPTVMLRTEILNRHNLRFSAEAGPAADTALWFDLNLLAGKLIVLHEVLYRYRVHPKQDSLVNEVHTYCQFFNYMNEFIKRHNLPVDRNITLMHFSNILAPRLRSRLIKNRIQLHEFLRDRQSLQKIGLWPKTGKVTFGIRLLLRRPMIVLCLVWYSIFQTNSTRC